MAGVDVAIKAITANAVKNGIGTILPSPTISDRQTLDNPHSYPTDPAALETRDTTRFDDPTYYTC